MLFVFLREPNFIHMPAKILLNVKNLLSDKRFHPLMDTGLFIIITLAIHYGYRYWEHGMQYYLFGFQVLTPGMFDNFTQVVFEHTHKFLNLLLPNETYGRTFVFENQCSVRIVPSCSGIKQMLQISLLLLIYPGPWKHKLWFIPMGIVIIHFTNIIRLTGLGIVMANWPEHWQFSHDYPARIIFYVVIFFLWVIWNDKFYRKTQKPIKKPADKV